MSECNCGCTRDRVVREKFDLFTNAFIRDLTEDHAGPIRRGERNALDHLLALVAIPFGRTAGILLVLHISHALRERASEGVLIADAMMEAVAQFRGKA